jgi:hypothetical protein
MKPIVYVLENRPFDFSTAEEYGEIRVLECGPFKPMSPVDKNSIRFERMCEELAEYRPGVDYILPTGSPIMSFAVGSIVGEHGRHRILEWNKLSKSYICYEITTGEEHVDA